MTERPIIFKGEMVRAILDDSKTQTRRVIKPDWYRCLDLDEPDDVKQAKRTCPYGVPGDRLWVREAHGFVWPDVCAGPPDRIEDWKVEYRADLKPGCTDYPGQWPASEARGNDEAPKWRPSIHMHRWASRITLEVAGIRVERVQEISKYDACCEGALGVDTDSVRPGYMAEARARQEEGVAPALGPGPLERFRWLWDSINGKRTGCSWRENPWVWAVDFRPVTELASTSRDGT